MSRQEIDILIDHLIGFMQEFNESPDDAAETLWSNARDQGFDMDPERFRSLLDRATAEVKLRLKTYQNPGDDLALTSVTEQGIHFETGVPVTFRFVRNTEKSPNFGSTYGQDVEPAGRYMVHNETPGEIARGWESGTMTFERPLVLLLTTDEHIYGPNGWKARLSRHYNATGVALTRKLLAEGWDGIVTVGEYRYQSGAKRGQTLRDTREILDLTPLRRRNSGETRKHHYLFVTTPGPLIIVRVPRPVPKWRSILAAVTMIMREHGLRQKDASNIEGFISDADTIGQLTPEERAFSAKLDAAFAGGPEFSKFWLYDWSSGNAKTELALKAARKEAEAVRRRIEALKAETTGTFKLVRKPDLKTRRNSDESIRELERRARSSPADFQAQDAYLRSLARTGRLTTAPVLKALRPFVVARRVARSVTGRRDIKPTIAEPVEGIKPSRFDKFVSWDEIFRQVETRPRERRSATESINEQAMEWALGASEYNTSSTIEEFESEHSVELTDEQRAMIDSLWVDVLASAYEEAVIVDLRRIVTLAVEYINTAASVDSCDNELAERGLRRPEQYVRGPRPAVRGWREGFDKDGERGVWFSLTRTFLRAYVESGVCYGGWDCSMAEDPGSVSMNVLDGSDVIRTAWRWGHCISEPLAFPRNREDIDRHIEYPSSEEIMAAVLEAGELVPKKEES